MTNESKKCPKCGATVNIIDSRYSKKNDAFRRRKACPKCGHKFTTYEKTEKSWSVTIDSQAIKDIISKTLDERFKNGMIILNPIKETRGRSRKEK